jgi:hypothetical protein
MRTKPSLALLDSNPVSHVPKSAGAAPEREYGFGDIARFVWRSRLHILSGTVISGLLGASFFLYYRLAVPPLTTYRTAITLTMPGANPGEYPNGMRFAPSDLRSPAVLNEVYRVNDVGALGVDFQKFSGMITVEAYSPVTESTIQRYRVRLENKQLTFEERKQIEAEFNATMQSLRDRALVVAVSISDGLNISQELGNKLASDIPAKWADLYMNRLGAMRLPVANSGAPLVDKALLTSLDYPLAYDYLIDQKDKMDKRIDEVGGLPGAANLLSRPSGKSFADLKRDLEAMAEFRMRRVLQPIVELGLSRTPEMTAIAYENMIGHLGLQIKTTAERSRLVTGIVADVDANTAQTNQPSAGGAGGTAVMQPIDGSFVDKIIELSSKSSGVAFRETLLEKKLGLDNDGVSTGELSTRYSNRLAAIRRFSAENGANPQLVSTFEKGVAAVIVELDRLWSEANDILEQANITRVGSDKSLYVSQELPGNAVMSREPLFTARMGVITAATALAGALLGFLVFGLQAFAKYARNNEA